MKIKRILCALALTACVSTAVAQQPTGSNRQQLDPATLSQAQIEQVQVPEALHRLVSLYQQKGDLERLAWALQRLTTLQPNVGDLKMGLAATYALQGEKAKTYDVLLGMEKVGYGFDLANDKRFSRVADTKVWTYIQKSMGDNLKPFGEGKVAFTLPKGDTLFDSLAFDSKRQQFLVGSVREGKVYRVGKDGKLEDFISPDAQNGLWSVYAMAADSDSDMLYVASTASVYYKGFGANDFGKAGVFKFRLSTGKLVDKYLLAPDSQPRTLSSVAIGKGGLVFVADGLRNTIYRLDGGELKPMVGNPRLTSLRGMAVSGDGKILYFTDYALGIFGVDLAAGKGFDLGYDQAKLTLGGIDGLYWYDHTLVAIQNGMSPHRVIRLTLDESGQNVIRSTPLDSSNPAFGLPTYGVVDGDGLYFVANSQKNSYDSYGTPRENVPLEPVSIFRSNLRFAWSDASKALPRAAAPLSTSKPGEGHFKNVEGGSQSVTGN